MSGAPTPAALAAPPTATARSVRRGYAQIACAAASWGLWSLFLRPAEHRHPIAPAIETLLMFGAVAAGLMPSALRDRPSERRPLSAWGGLVALGLCDAANNLCFFWAMQRASLAIAVLSHYLAPLVVAVAAPVVLGERARASLYAAVGVAIAGLALLVEPWRSVDRGALAGALLGATSAIFYAATTLLNKGLQHRFSSRELLAYHAVPALVALLFFVRVDDLRVGLAPLGIVAAGAFVLSAAGGALYLDGLVRVPASRAAVLTLLEPMVAVLIGATVWGERLDALGAWGVALMLGGAYAVLREPARAA